MTALEFDQLVRDIGGEVLLRLGPNKPADHACACATHASSQQAATQQAAPSQPLNGAASRGLANRSVAQLIHQSLAHPDATDDEVRRLCAEAVHYRFASVCVQPSRVALAVRELRGKVKVSAVIGFPYGATLTPVKLAEAEQVLKLGARALEVVLDPGALKSGDLDAVYTEIHLLAACAHAADAALKVVAEMALLREEQKAMACALARLGGAETFKTGSGLVAAEAADVKLAHRIVGGELRLEAAGEIDSYARMREMMAAGATDISTTQGAAVVTEAAHS